MKVLLVSFLWFFSHFFSVGYITKQKYFFVVVNIFLMLVFYFNIGLIGDMIHGYIYDVQHLENSRFVYRLELGFVYLASFFNFLSGSNYEVTLYLLQIFEIIMFLVLIKFFNKRNLLISISIGILSIFLFLGLENVYRQGLASIFIVLSVYFLIKNRLLISIFLAVIAQSIHYSSIFFEFLILITFFFRRKYFLLNNFFIKISFFKYLLLVILVILFSFIFVKILYSYFPIDRNNDRNFGMLKVISISFIFFITSYLFSKSLLDKLSYFIFMIRGLFFALFIGTSLVGGAVGIELASRLLFFYFLLEIVLVIRVFSENFYSKIGSIIVLLSYGIAINIYVLLEQVGTYDF